MDSTTFRREYARLTQPTEVTVNGHAIGTWLPSPYSAAEFRSGVELREVSLVHTDAAPGQMDRAGAYGFNTRPFTPVPKKGK
jgi:hypothetical protein